MVLMQNFGSVEVRNRVDDGYGWLDGGWLDGWGWSGWSGHDRDSTLVMAGTWSVAEQYYLEERDSP